MSHLSKETLESAKITVLPDHFYYIPNFISPEEEASILQKIPPNRWTQLTHRRLQPHPSPLTPTNVLLAAPLPPWLSTHPPLLPRFHHLALFDSTPHASPNHVLVNEYRPGEGIMPHEDGAAYAPVVATVSLGGATCLDIYEKVDGEGTETAKDGRVRGKYRILQEPRSLLITMGRAYVDLLHGIAPVEVDENLNADTVANWGLLGAPGDYEDGRSARETRVSLTYRDVLKVSQVMKGLFGRQK
ncbi:hypothetical protein P152DRAFT_428778 [Eremomyces bilateralis CBS 781.70]|uniref:Fe2OG dioxygenase domain-containing protein n=1 Tax=Eremomyces bilateralis CBS 781.70 TaxID=1392243 RepID=A0A6G1GEZ3_9PEZI|nr:uncharacterized protein P152DRAFT_428778 [Eremomyces bilateralis CBS 781.70]KAF1816572.1 hypothetical protein P152DRAFT_428778 [Eremomyces bilateralis CBS 781.70]